MVFRLTQTTLLTFSWKTSWGANLSLFVRTNTIFWRSCRVCQPKSFNSWTMKSFDPMNKFKTVIVFVSA
jgi:hypothetical protein